MSSTTARILIHVILVIGILLRIVLGIVNHTANDDHLGVSKFIITYNRTPKLPEAWEAYHPKLYHMTIALIWKALPSQPFDVIVRLAQMINVGAGIATIVIAGKFLEKMSITERVRVLAFGLVALNPRLISINAQATNDSFVILFSTAALYFGYQLFTAWRLKTYCLIVATLILAGLSKGSGLIIFIATVIGLAMLLLQRDTPPIPRRQIALFMIVTIIMVMPFMLVLAPYGEHYHTYGSPFATNLAPKLLPDSWPPLFSDQARNNRQGLTSLTDTFMTFRLMSLLQTPHNTSAPYPAHMTSMWSQLYARTHFIHLEPWPWGGWKEEAPFVSMLGRTAFLAGLLPTLLLITGLVRGIIMMFKWLVRFGKNFHEEPRILLMQITALGYTTLIILFVIRYMGLNAMKAIYIFPGLLAFLFLFTSECNNFYQWLTSRRLPRTVVEIIFSLLFLVYIVDVAVLINQLR